MIKLSYECRFLTSKLVFASIFAYKHFALLSGIINWRNNIFLVSYTFDCLGNLIKLVLLSLYVKNKWSGLIKAKRSGRYCLCILRNINIYKGIVNENCKWCIFPKLKRLITAIRDAPDCGIPWEPLSAKRIVRLFRYLKWIWAEV